MIKDTLPTPLLTFPGAMVPGLFDWLFRYLTEYPQGLHWAKVCQVGVVHGDREAGAEVQDGTGWTFAWMCNKTCVRA